MYGADGSGSVYEYNPGNTPGLPAGWEISLYEQGDYITLTLWRVRAMLKPYKETVRKGDEALHWTGGNYGTAYLPVGYNQDDVDEALQELVLKAEQFDATLDENEAWINEDLPKQANRLSRTDYFRKLH